MVLYINNPENHGSGAEEMPCTTEPTKYQKGVATGDTGHEYHSGTKD